MNERFKAFFLKLVKMGLKKIEEIPEPYRTTIQEELDNEND